MQNFTTLIGGHSHAAALGIPMRDPEGKPAIVPIPGHPSIAGITGNCPRDDAYWSALVEHGKGRTVVLVWRGNQHLTRFMFEPRPKIDFVLSTQPELPIRPGAVIVPEMKIRQAFDGTLADLTAFLQRLNAAAAARVIVLGTPPPKDDDRFIRVRLRRESTFATMAKHFGLELAKAPLTPPLLRYKLWALLQDTTRRAAIAQGAEFLPSPPEALTEKLALAKEYWGEDVTHANHAYGELVLRQLERLNGKSHASV